MTFSEYYKSEFQSDLHQLIEGAKTMKEYGSHATAQQPALQSITVSKQNPTVMLWSKQRSDLFSVALYFTVLVDQVCYTHLNFHYDRFRELTLYPKYVGQCLSICHTHLDPSYIIKHVGNDVGIDNSSVKPPEIEKRHLLISEATPVMNYEVLEFCERHMPELKGERFWEICLAQVKLLNTSHI